MSVLQICIISELMFFKHIFTPLRAIKFKLELRKTPERAEREKLLDYFMYE